MIKAAKIMMSMGPRSLGNAGLQVYNSPAGRREPPSRPGFRQPPTSAATGSTHYRKGRAVTEVDERPGVRLLVAAAELGRDVGSDLTTVKSTVLDEDLVRVHASHDHAGEVDA